MQLTKSPITIWNNRAACSFIPRPLPLYGVKLVGNNIDWMIHPHFVQIDQQTQSIHYFNCYAVKGRIDLSSLSDALPRIQPSMSEVMCKVLPSAHEESVMHDDFAILLARMLCTHVTYFNCRCHWLAYITQILRRDVYKVRSGMWL